MDAERYDRITALRAELEDAQRAVEQVRERLHGAILDAFPERRGHPPARGVLAEVARRSGYSREHVAKLRDGKA